MKILVNRCYGGYSISRAAISALAELEIVEIPDGVKWAIDEYDGMGTIDEEHRSW